MLVLYCILFATLMLCTAAEEPHSESLRAYVVTQNPYGRRFAHTSSLLGSIGIFKTKSIQVSVVSSDQETQQCAALKVHRDAWLQFAEDSDRVDEWALFFEDDIQLHPSLSLSSSGALLYKLFSRVNKNIHFSSGVVYLGMCGPNRHSQRYTESGMNYTHTCGFCLHAYALRRDAVIDLWREMKRLSKYPVNDTHWNYNRCENLDALLRRYCEDPLVTLQSNRSGFPLIQPDTHSPDSIGNDHYGVFYQWRSHFKSLISNRQIDPPQ